MKLRFWFARWRRLLVILFFAGGAGSARAHVGSPDVFFDGMIGPYPAQVTIRMPGVVPGLAVIDVRVQSAEPVGVTFRPLFSRVAISNAPPPDAGVSVPGESNLYSGQLWLMSSGAYTIDISVRGKSGEGTALIPVNSRATRQLPLPFYLGALLAALGLLLVAGGVAIVASTAEATLPAGIAPGPRENRRRWIASGITAAVFALALVGGKKWWNADEKEFRSRLVEGGWPDLQGSARIENGERILKLTIGEKTWDPNKALRLAPDHGKLLHFFLLRLPKHDAFAHIHPIRTGNQTFDVAVPPLPEGDYEMFCDLTLDDSGLSSTATNVVHLPAPPAAEPSKLALAPDPDDSWTASASAAAETGPGQDTVSHAEGGLEVVWKAHPPLRVNQDADLHFELRDASGQVVALEPYMGMLSHVAVVREDGRVFAHLHPSGNFSMAAQALSFARMDGGTNAGGAMPMGMDMAMTGMDMAGMDHTMMDHMMHHPSSGATSVSLPYQFPSAGKYRLWVQVKTDGRVVTGIFDARVE